LWLFEVSIEKNDVHNTVDGVEFRAGKNLGFLEFFYRFLGFLGFLGFNVHNAEYRYMTHDK